MFSRLFRLSGGSSRATVSSRWLALCLALCALLAACGQTSTATTPAQPTATPAAALDVYGTPITFPTTAPQRIVSLSPSMSEILGGLNLDSRVVAVDYYTTSPTDLTTKPKISDANGT